MIADADAITSHMDGLAAGHEACVLVTQVEVVCDVQMTPVAINTSNALSRPFHQQRRQQHNT